MTQGTGMKAQSDNTQDSSELPGLLPSSSKKPGADFESTLDRMKTACRVKSDKMLADALDVKHSTITTSRRRGAVPASWLLTISDKTGVSVDWLRTGEGEMKRGGAQFAKIRPGERWDDPRPGSEDGPLWKAGLYQRHKEEPEPQASIYDDSEGEDFDLAEVLAQTLDILKSKTVYTTAIVSNIKAFHKAITTEKKIDEMQGQLNQALSSFQDQLDKTNQLVQGLRSENAQLRHDLEESRAASAVRDTG
jgi:hypothetical protein